MDIHRRRARNLRVGFMLLFATFVLLLPGCATRSVGSNVLPALAASREDLVVFVPGITGSSLYDLQSQRLTWGDFRSLFYPRDGGYDAALPLGGGTDRIEPRAPIQAVRGGPWIGTQVYGPLLKALEDNGYPRGDPARPGPTDRLFAFGYDWRRDGVESARQLARLLERLSAVRGGMAEVTLVCHSSAGSICRWAARFGDVSLEEAELGTTRPVAGVRLRGLVLIATASGGALRVLRELDRGRRYVQPGGRRFLPEAFFTYEGLYRELPLLEEGLFVDEHGAALAVDLADPESWRTHHWSIFRPEAQPRISRRPDLFGSEDERMAFLRRALDRGRRIQQALLGPTPLPAGTRLHTIQSTERLTPSRAVLVRQGSRWQTRFAGDADLAPEMTDRLTTLGDGHGSIASQFSFSPAELAALAGSVREVPGGHLGVVTSPQTHRIVLDALLGDPPAVASSAPPTPAAADRAAKSH